MNNSISRCRCTRWLRTIMPALTLLVALSISGTTPARGNPSRSDQQDLPLSAEKAQQIVEQSLEAYRNLQSYRHIRITEQHWETEGWLEGQAPENTTDQATFSFLAPGHFSITKGSYSARSDDATVWIYNADLHQYIEIAREDLLPPLNDWLESATTRQLSLPFTAKVLLNRDAGVTDVLDGLKEFVGARSAEHNGKPGHWVVAHLRDTWYRSGETIKVELWFNQETGFLEASRGDFTDAYQFALSLSQKRTGWSADDEDQPKVTSATWSSTYTNIIADEDLPLETFAFAPGTADRRVDRFETTPVQTYSRADQLRLIGESAPDFSGETLDGKELSLSDLRGRVVLLDFWATWCGPCVMAIPHIQDVAEHFSDQPVTVLGVNRDRPGSDRLVKKFVEGKGLTFQQVMDRDGSIAADYYVTGIPSTILIDKEGVVQDVTVGFSPTHKTEFINQIDALLEGRDVVDKHELRERIAGAKKEDRQRDMRFRFRFENPALLALIGEEAPEFEATDLQGDGLRLSDFKDQVLLLYFWMWTPEREDRPTGIDNRQLHRAIQRVAEKYEGAAFSALGICSEHWGIPEEIRDWLEENNITLRQILDETGEIRERFAIRSYPCMMLIGKNGVVQDVTTGNRLGMDRELATKVDRLLAGESLVDKDELIARKEAAEEYSQRFPRSFLDEEELEVQNIAPDALEEIGRLGGNLVGGQRLFVDVDDDGASELILTAGSNILAIISSDGSSVRRLRLQGLPTHSAQITELVPIDMDQGVGWFASAMSWESFERGAVVGLYSPAGDELWKFEAPPAIIELKEGERVSTSSNLAAGDLDNDGTNELLVAVTYVKWSQPDDDSQFGSIGSHMVGHLFVLNLDGSILSQTDVGASIRFIEVLPSAEPDSPPTILCGADGAVHRYRFNRQLGLQRE